MGLWDPKLRPASTVQDTLDGYLTVDFEDWHLHPCIGERTSAPPEAACLRRTAHAEPYRRLNPAHQPTS